MQCDCGSYNVERTGLNMYHRRECGRTWRVMSPPKKNGHNKPKKQERKRGRR